MLLIQNKRVNWDTCQIGIPGATAKDRENRRIEFNPKGRLAAILKCLSARLSDCAGKEYSPDLLFSWGSYCCGEADAEVTVTVMSCGVWMLASSA